MAYTGWIPVTISKDTEVLDIPTMSALDIESYKAYVREHLMWVDHHEVLRSSLAEFPYATSPAQVDALISVLQEFRARMVS
ncbi:hypothetical protein [Variovorax sp. DAIF25]|uniref:hypothetical protein n=1 Tax=Variovorax sp. DAIF25 TaxID=3080983 RepID=UPI003D6A1A5E